MAGVDEVDEVVEAVVAFVVFDAELSRPISKLSESELSDLATAAASCLASGKSIKDSLVDVVGSIESKLNPLLLSLFLAAGVLATGDAVTSGPSDHPACPGRHLCCRLVCQPW